MRILLVTTRFPYPPRRGQQVRAAEWIEALKDHERILVCPRPEGDDWRAERDAAGIDVRMWPDSSAARVLATVAGAVRGRPLQESLYRTAAARRVLDCVAEDVEPDLVIVQMVRCAWAAELLEARFPAIPILFDAVDSMGLHYHNVAAGTERLLRWGVRVEAGRCRRYEVALAGRAALTTAVAGRDLEALETPAGKGLVVPVAGKATGQSRNPSPEPTILLSGNLGYRPTVEGVVRFADEVWEPLRNEVPGVRWILAGARPARRVMALASRPGVEVHADVPDLGPFLASAWVGLAPMSTGSGVPMKVLEAWAAGLPMVVHPWTADGLVEEGRSAVCEADGAEAWVSTLSELLENQVAREKLTVSGLAIWDRFYRPETVALKIREAVAMAAESTRT